MRRLLIASVVFVLTGCGYFEIRDDPVEQHLYVSLAVQSDLGSQSCKDPNTNIVRATLKQMELYSEMTVVYSDNDSNKDINTGATVLRDLIKEMGARYASKETPSMKYCELKFATIKDGATRMFRTLQDAN